MSEFVGIISIFHNFCWRANSHTGARKSASFAGARIRTLVCEKKTFILLVIYWFKRSLSISSRYYKFSADISIFLTYAEPVFSSLSS